MCQRRRTRESAWPRTWWAMLTICHHVRGRLHLLVLSVITIKLLYEFILGGPDPNPTRSRLGSCEQGWNRNHGWSRDGICEHGIPSVGGHSAPSLEHRTFPDSAHPRRKARTLWSSTVPRQKVNWLLMFSRCGSYILYYLFPIYMYNSRLIHLVEWYDSRLGCLMP